MSQVVFYRAENVSEYKALCLESGLDLDVFYQPEFLALEAHRHASTYEIYCYREGVDFFIYPYLRKLIWPPFQGYSDLLSPYGYCGPYCTTESIFPAAEQVFLEYCRREKVVSEFVRYHVLYNRHRLFSENIRNEENRTVLFLNLAKDWEDIWMGEFSPKNRNLCRKLSQEGYRFELIDYGQGFEEFITMYKQTMDHVGAVDYYYFTNEYFKSLQSSLGPSVVLGRVVKDGVTYSSALFFIAGGILTYHLSARNLKFPAVPSSNLLLSKVAEFGHNAGLHFFNLGGGLTNSQDDSLLRFKSNFSKDRRPFVIGKRIHKPEVYEAIVNQWIARKGPDQYQSVKNILQFYHEG